MVKEILPYALERHAVGYGLLDTQIPIWVDSRSEVGSNLATRGEVVYWGNGLL